MNVKFGMAAAALAVAGLLGLGAPARAADDIVIGFATAQSGFITPYDADGVKMAQMWIDQTNAKGGLLGKQIKWVMADTKSDRTEGASAGQAVLRQGAQVVVVSCDYDFGAPAALQAQRAGVISVSICAGDPKMGVLGVGNLSFSASVAAQVEGAALADWAYKQRSMKTGYVLLDDSIEYDKSLCAGYEWLFPQLGGKIVGKDSFKNGDPSIASQITRLAGVMKTQKVDAIMLCSYIPGGASAMRQIRAAGINVPIMAGVGMDGIFWLASVPNLTDYYVAVQASIFDDPHPEVKALYDDFVKKYGKPPTNQHAFPMYAWLQLWAKAVTETGTTDGKTVVAKMETYKDVPTALGPRTYTHDTHIQTRIPMTINEISEGSGKVVATVNDLPEIPRDLLYRTGKFK